MVGSIFMMLVLLIILWFKSSGGVVVASQDGKIVLENTLDARLNVVFRQKLPEVCIPQKGLIFFPDVSFYLSKRCLLWCLNLSRSQY